MVNKIKKLIKVFKDKFLEKFNDPCSSIETDIIVFIITEYLCIFHFSVYVIDNILPKTLLNYVIINIVFTVMIITILYLCRVRTDK